MEAWGQPDDARQRIDFVSEYVERMLGYSVEEWLAAPNFWLGIVHPEDHERAAQEAADIYAGRRPGKSEFRWLTRDGRPLWVEARSVVVHDQDGAPIGMRGVSMDVSERHRREEERAGWQAAIDEERLRLQTLVGTLPGVVWEDWGESPPETRSRFVNRRIEEMLGYGIEEWNSRPGMSLEIVHAEDRERVLAARQASLASGEGGSAEFRFIARDGRVVWVDERWVVIRDAAGKPVGLRGVTIDVTERKRVEQELRQVRSELSEQLWGMLALQAISLRLSRAPDLNAVFATILDGAMELHGSAMGVLQLHDVERRELSVAASRGLSDEYLRLVGRVPVGTASCGTAVAERRVVIVEDVEADPLFASHLDAARLAGYRSAYSVPLLDREGDAIAVVTSYFPGSHRPTDAQIRVTELFSQQAGLALQNARLYQGSREAQGRLAFLAEASALLASSLDYEATLRQVVRLVVPRLGDMASVYELTAAGEVRRLAWAHAEAAGEAVMRDLARFPFDTIQPNPVAEVLAGGGTRVFTAEEIAGALAEAKAEPERLVLLRRLAPRAAALVPLLSRERVVGALAVASGEASRGYGEDDLVLLQDLARRCAMAIESARLFQESRRIQEELRRANEAKDEFLGMVSHELRTPITTLYGGTRLLRSRGGQMDEQTRAELLQDMERESDRLFRLVEDLLVLARVELGTRMELQPVLPGPIISKVMRSFERTLPGRPLTTELEPELPPVTAEPVYLEQVLRNLVHNAHKYSPPGAGITARAFAVSGGMVQISVLDRGPGIDPAESEAIFERFYRSGRTSTMAQGAGMGLTVCRRLVEAMSGRIWAQLHEGGGLEVSFTLPVSEEAEA